MPTPTLFGMPLIDAELERKVAEYGIEVHYDRELVEVDAASQTIELAGDDTAVTVVVGQEVAVAALGDDGAVVQQHDAIGVVQPQG